MFDVQIYQEVIDHLQFILNTDQMILTTEE